MLRIALIGDVHFSTAGPREGSLLLHRSETILERALDQIASSHVQPDLLIQIGDLIDGQGQTFEQARADLDRAVEMFDRSELRWTWVPGNHDYVGCGGRKWLLPRLRRSQTWDEIVVGDDVLLLMDSSCSQVFGRIGTDQQEWLEEALARHADRHVFVFVHHVFDWSVEDDMYIEDGETIRSLLIGSRAVKAVFMGHAHTDRIDAVEGLHEIVTNALTRWPLSYRWVEIERDRLRIRTEKVEVRSDILSEAKEACDLHRKSWRPEVRDCDLAADLPLR